MLLLASDICILFLFVGGILWFFIARRNTFWRKAFDKISKDRAAMVSLFILCIYISICILDSLHFKLKDAENTSQTYSVLDMIFTDLKEKTEKTYSAPLYFFIL